MLLSDVSIKRPVVAVVASIVVVLIGLLSFNRLPVREYPLIDSPVVSVETSYRGASAEVVEAKITEPLDGDALNQLDQLEPAVALGIECERDDR